jgi:hypothetical protein
MCVCVSNVCIFCVCVCVSLMCVCVSNVCFWCVCVCVSNVSVLCVRVCVSNVCISRVCVSNVCVSLVCVCVCVCLMCVCFVRSVPLLLRRLSLRGLWPGERSVCVSAGGGRTQVWHLHRGHLRLPPLPGWALTHSHTNTHKHTHTLFDKLFDAHKCKHPCKYVYTPKRKLRLVSEYTNMCTHLWSGSH